MIGQVHHGAVNEYPEIREVEKSYSDWSSLRLGVRVAVRRCSPVRRVDA